jgi:excisionase family DNA binding protein
MENKDIPGKEFFSVFADQIADAVVNRLGKAGEGDPIMLSPRSIAKKLDCSVSEVRMHLQQHRIPTVRFGRRGYRVPREEFEKRIDRWKKGGELWD